MQLKRLSVRFRRQLRQQQRQVEGLSEQAERGFERHMLRRFARLRAVRRFVLAWVALLLLLIGCTIAELQALSGYYQRQQPVPGGIYSEGLAGSFTNANPLYATSEVDTSLSRLLFAGLFTYNADNQLVGELASGYTVNSSGLSYTVHLKPHLTWQDGRPLTSADVLFTYQTIQDPDAQSPLLSSWQGIGLSAPNPSTVVFTLPSPLASFPTNLTNGIVPQHLLGNIAPADLRAADFNTEHPVGAGPFAWQGLQVSGNDPSNAEEQIALVPFAGYANGQPKLSEFIIRAYANAAQLRQAFADGQLTAADLEAVPAALPMGAQAHSLLQTAGTYVFFKTDDSGPLSDVKVRQALVAASDPASIIAKLGYATRPVTEPLLEGQLAFTPKYQQRTGNLAAAQKLLAADGWKRGTSGALVKKGQPLSFNLVVTDTPENRQVSAELKRQWRALGAQLQVQLESADDYATSLQNRTYDATLSGISIGTDPDVFVYWDSSQADVRSADHLNLSDWRDPTADASLEAGRTRLLPALRVIKYQPFLKAWQQQAPALGLYQPRYLYLTRGTVYGLPAHAINTGTDRFDNVQDWEIRTARVTD